MSQATHESATRPEAVTKGPHHSPEKLPSAETMLRSNVDSIMAMAEKIEWLMRQSRPSLSLTLKGTQGGVVDIEKVSRGTVKIRLSRSDVLSLTALNQLQHELKAKGLSWVMDESGPRVGVKQ